jgi:hypothetical protein
MKPEFAQVRKFTKLFHKAMIFEEIADKSKRLPVREGEFR